MKRILIILCLLIINPIWSFSQTIYPKEIVNKEDTLILITPQQLVQTNLIFAEHKKLFNENDLLLDKIDYYQSLVKTNEEKIELLNRIVSISKFETDLLSEQLVDLQDYTDRQDKMLNVYKGIAISGITLSIGLIAVLVLGG